MIYTEPLFQAELMLVLYWIITFLNGIVSGIDIHLILEADLNDDEVQWSVDYIEQSFTDSSKFNVHVRKLKNKRLNLLNCK